MLVKMQFLQFFVLYSVTVGFRQKMPEIKMKERKKLRMMSSLQIFPMTISVRENSSFISMMVWCHGPSRQLVIPWGTMPMGKDMGRNETVPEPVSVLPVSIILYSISSQLSDSVTKVFIVWPNVLVNQKVQCDKYQMVNPSDARL